MVNKNNTIVIRTWHYSSVGRWQWACYTEAYSCRAECLCSRL